MSVFGKRAGGGRRRAEREHLPLIAVFTTRTRSHSAVLVDVSKTGARLRGLDLPTRDEDVAVKLEGVSAFAVVRWSRLGYCGIEFDTPLTTGQMKFLENRACRARGLPPELVAAMDDWTLGLAR